MRVRRYIAFVVVLVAALFPCGACGQVYIRSLFLQRDMCAGSTQTVSFGSRFFNTVVVGHRDATMGRSEQVFLPDGVECDGSCSYRSPVTFTVFDDDALITSAENIKYVRLKLEHSFIGDIYINITCSNGQKADIMRKAGDGSSECGDRNIIPEGSTSWLPGNNMDVGTFFGIAKDQENPSDPCNANAQGNQPGTGWNYCWSNNTTQGYQYASGDGIVYRAGHAHSGKVDSSNVAAHANFYHPDENFSNLVGCPLNGTWYIEVVDGWGSDNGYIFEWELSLDESLLPNDCQTVGFDIQGLGVQRIGDSSFTITAPVVAADSSVEYHFQVLTSCGDTVDTSAFIVFHPNVDIQVYDTICQGDDHFVGHYNADSSGTYPLNTVYGCDSSVYLTLTVNPSYDTLLKDSTCFNNPYPFEGNVYTENGTYTHRMLTDQGCDSLRTLQLTILSKNLKADIYAFPLVVTEKDQEIILKDVSMNHVGSRWMIGDGSFSQREITLTYPYERDSLEISLEAVSREGCYDTATVVARCDRSRVFVPNVFTPSLEQNDRWQPVMQDVVEAEVWIYSRQGMLVAHLVGIDESWDGGTWPQGTYTYLLRYRTRAYPDRLQERSGTIVMIR